MNNAARKPIKVYVAVKADFAENGKMIPRQITWEDGTKYEIDRILDVRQAVAIKARREQYRSLVRGTKDFAYVAVVFSIILAFLQEKCYNADCNR